MNTDELSTIANELVKRPKGILAIDESTATCDARFEAHGIERTEAKRREYRELLITCPHIEEYVSGYIVFDETLRQSTDTGVPFPSALREKNIITGIKVDLGLEPFGIGEEVTKGLDGLEDRLTEYYALGARFTKWRAVYHIGKNTPTEECMRENALRLARYAKTVQQAGMVPIIEPEVLMHGEHTIEDAYNTTVKNLKIVFDAVAAEGVFLPGLLLKTSMVIHGDNAPVKASIQEVAAKTIQALVSTVPPTIAGVVFLSGGQDDDLATAHLNAMHISGVDLPWPLTFSYGRAIQDDALALFAKGKYEEAQEALLLRAKNNSLASIGNYE